MQHATDLSETEIYDVGACAARPCPSSLLLCLPLNLVYPPYLSSFQIFDRLDVNGSGTIEFDEFYLLVCMMISVSWKT